MRGETYARIWFMENPLRFDGKLDLAKEAIAVADIAPQECCVFAPAVPRAMEWGDRIELLGPALAVWYPHPSRKLTRAGQPFLLEQMAIELIASAKPIDPRGRKLIKVV